MKNKIIISLLFCIQIVFSQNYNFKPPQITPNSPEVASLIKYTDLPVTNYNGTSSYSINLYTIKEGDLNFPININYSNNGLKVDEEASSIGLGWSLFAGGVIQKFHNKNNYNNVGIIPNGAYQNISATDENYYETNQIENKFQSGCSYPNLNGVVFDVTNYVSLLNYGYTHDYYYYNFAGLNGKFIKDTNDNFVNSDRSNIKFINNGNNTLKAIATDGTQYFFELVGNTTTIRPANTAQPCQSLPGADIQTDDTFYLTKIISPNGRTILFSYIENTIETLPQLSEWYTTSNQNNVDPLRSIALVSTIKEYIINEINTENVKIKFFVSSRIDIKNGKKINQMEVYRQGELNPIRTIVFENSYFIGDSTYGDFTTSILPSCSFINNTSTLDTRSKRLKLNSINFKDNNLSIIESYGFEYFTDVLPYKTSRSKDIWGYFNGKLNSTLIPNINQLGYYDNFIPVEFYTNPPPVSGDRSSDEEKMKYGLLKKITLPTGGYTEISYEINEFYNPGMNNQISEVTKEVSDIGNGKSQLVFTVPSVGYFDPFQGGSANPATINTHVVCTAPYLPCSNATDNGSSNCWGYNNPNSGAPNSDNRLYALLEKQNTNGTWSLVDDPYDRFNQQMINSGSGTCGFQKSLYLVPGTYRITANYPDNLNGYLGGPWSYIKVKFLDYMLNQNYSYGAGLRIKSVKNYTQTAELATEKHFTYSIGRLMNKPIFTSHYNEISTIPQYISSGASYNNCDYAFGGCPACPTNVPDQKTIYSNPLLSFTNSANGYLVGYDEVIVSNGESNQNGREIYKYMNDFDNLFNYPNISSSITPTPKLRNGMLYEKITQKKSSSGILLTSLVEKNTFKVNDLKIYWDYYTENRQIIPCAGDVSCGINFKRLLIHFKPIIVASTKLKNKTVEEFIYDENDNFVSKNSVTNYYQYNIKNQLISEQFFNSKSEFVEHKTYYPNELILGSQSGQMQELIALNRIDIPIKTEDLLLGTQLKEEETKYINDSNTGFKTLPKEIHIVKGNSNININLPDNRKIIYDKYDSFANVLQYTLDNGASTTFIWGYNKTLPIAKIENATNAQVQTALGVNLSDVTEANMSIINALRTSLPNAMVTTYTHIPLVGVSTITDPKGDTITYIYDSFNRLKEVQDKNGNKLSENEYHYRPQN